MNAHSEISYEELPYTNFPFPQTHPDRIAAIAVLLGLSPPRDRCRVLELGCASGGNLIPMAVSMPDAQLVGIDLSARQIGEGRAVVDALGLRNVVLHAANIADFDVGAGVFDYIVAHGVYSWVADGVQSRILEICRRQLAPGGVAFVSYNTLPGWRTRAVVRDLMRYHAAQFADARTKIEQARAIGDFLVAGIPANTPYKAALASEVEAVRRESDAYVAHEHLEPTNDPLYFHQFTERAAAVGMQYLGDADFGSMYASNLPAGVAQRLAHLAPDVVRREQYMDFLRDRTFRQTLLVHDGVTIDRNIAPHRLRTLRVSGSFEPEGQAGAWTVDAVATFRAARGVRLRATSAIARALATALGRRWPQALPFGELTQGVVAELREHGAAPANGPDIELALANDVLRWFAAGAIQLHARPAAHVHSAGAIPRASPLARWQASREPRVTNLRHELVQLSAEMARLVQLLDGTRTRDELVSIAVPWEIAKAALAGAPIPPDPARFVGPVVADALEQLAKSALLVA